MIRIAIGFILAAIIIGSTVGFTADTDPGKIVRALRSDPEKLELRRELRAVRQQRDKAQRRVRRQYLTIDSLRGQLRRAGRHYPSIPHMIEVAAAAYGQNAETLKRKAYCESKFWPFARNNPGKDSPMGLFQFRPSTWRSIPFGRFSIWDPWAQALGAAYMHAHLRGGEWACR